MYRLEVADTFHSITELSENAYRSEIPGFQVSSQFFTTVGMLAIMDAIEEGAHTVLHEPVPFTHAPPLWNEPGEYSPHTDAGFRGLSVHHNQDGIGIVQLAHLLDGTQSGEKRPRVFIGESEGTYRQYTGNGIEQSCQDVPHGAVHQGEIEPGKLTIFSQGNIADLVPAIHYFKRTKGGNSWTRYGSSLTDRDLIDVELQDAAYQFRLGYLSSDYYALHLNSHFDPTAKLLSENHPGRNIRSGVDDTGRIRYRDTNIPAVIPAPVARTPEVPMPEIDHDKRWRFFSWLRRKQK